MRAKLFIALGALVAMGWAVPSAGTAPFIAEGTSRSLSFQDHVRSTEGAN
jgi:hypothetical protein